jgi:hypothetical protein
LIDPSKESSTQTDKCIIALLYACVHSDGGLMGQIEKGFLNKNREWEGAPEWH